MAHHESRASGVSFAAILASAVLCALVFVAGFFIVKYMAARWSPTVLNAERLLRRGRIDEAIALASRVRDEGGGGAAANLVLGKAWLAKAYRSEDEAGWKNYGTDPSDYFAVPEARKSMECLRAALRKNPRSIEARYYLGVLSMEKGRHAAAESEFLDILRMQPEHAGTRVNLAALYVMTGRLNEAEAELVKAYLVEPKNPAIAKNLGFLYRYYLNDPQKALEWSNRYLNLNPQNDPDRMFIHHDFVAMLRRYPEYAPEEEPAWKQAPRFAPRR